MIEANYYMRQSAETINGLPGWDIPVLGRSMLAVLPTYQSRLTVAPFELGADGSPVMNNGTIVKQETLPRFALMRVEDCRENDDIAVRFNVFGGLTGIHLGLGIADLDRIAGGMRFRFSHRGSQKPHTVGLSFLVSHLSDEEVNFRVPGSFNEEALIALSSYYDGVISDTLGGLIK